MYKPITKQEFHIPIEIEGKTAVDFLSEVSGLSKQKIKQAMQKGCVWLEKSGIHANVINKKENQKNYIQRLRRAKKILAKGEILHCYYDESVLETQPPEAKLLSDEGDYSIWNKPSGMLSQGSKWGDHCTINRWAEKHLKPERSAFIVHRLDRAASGLMIIAHKKQVASLFGQLFQQHNIKKHYRVSVEGDFTTLFTASKLSNDGEMVKTIDAEIDNKPAVSHCRIINYDESNNETKLDVEIETGRKHQIRKHLSGLGFPVVGDRLYGSVKNKTDLKLKAVFLRFNCPVSGEEKQFKL